MYFDELVLELVLSFCGPSLKPVSEFLTTGVYVVKNAQGIKRYNILEINEKWIVVSKKKEGVVSIKKVRNNDPKESKTLGITPFNKLECLFEEQEWKEEMKWGRHSGITINYRIHNLKLGLPLMAEPLALFDAMLDSEELERLVLWREIQCVLSYKKWEPLEWAINRIKERKLTRSPPLSTAEELVEIRTIEQLGIRCEYLKRNREFKRSKDLLKILREEME